MAQRLDRNDKSGEPSAFPAPRAFDRTTPPLILTLVLMTSVNTMSMNVFLPSLPGMARHFNADYAVVQLTVSAYLVATALLQLVIGPASDRFGRRPVILACLAIFLVASVGTLVSPTIEILIAFRVLQAFSVAGMVLSRAIVRDTVEADEAAAKIGYVTMGMAVVPMIAPTIGGLLDQAFGWKSTFWLIFLFGLAASILAWFDLGETNRQKTSSMAAQLGHYPELARSRRFWGYALTAGFTSGTFFAFLGGGPFVATEILHLSPVAYGLYFGVISLGYIGGNYVTARFTRRVGMNQIMLLGGIFSFVGVAGALILFELGIFHPLSFFGPMLFLGVGNGLALPNANAGIVSVRPHIAGSAAGLGGAIQVGSGALLAILAGAVISVEAGAGPLLFVMLASCVSAIVASGYVIHVARKAGEL